MPRSILDDPDALQGAIRTIQQNEHPELQPAGPRWKEPRVKFSGSVLGGAKALDECRLTHLPSGRQFRFDRNNGDQWFEVEPDTFGILGG